MAKNTSYDWLQVRLSPEEKEVVKNTASAYRVDVSTLVRAALNYVIETRPTLEVHHAGKLSALESLNS